MAKQHKYKKKLKHGAYILIHWSPSYLGTFVSLLLYLINY